MKLTQPVPSPIPCHGKYSQSEYRKAVVYSTVLHALSWYTKEYPTCHLYFLKTRLKARAYPETIQVTRGIFHGIPLESVV